MKKQKRLLSPEYEDHVRMLGKREARGLEKHKAQAFPGFECCLQMMRSKNAVIQEDGFHFLAPHASEHLDELHAALRAEEDRGLRAWLLELIAETKTPRIFPILVEYWFNSDEFLRHWAEYGLKALGTTSEGRRLLWETHLYGQGIPLFVSEDQARTFREDLVRFIKRGK